MPPVYLVSVDGSIEGADVACVVLHDVERMLYPLYVLCGYVRIKATDFDRYCQLLIEDLNTQKVQKNAVY